MTKAQITKALEKLAALQSKNNDACIEAGLGNERFSESRLSNNPLSIERCKLADQEYTLRQQLSAITGERRTIRC